MKRIAIFASGAGSNAQKIIEHSLLPTTSKGGGEKPFEVALIVCNKPGAGVINIAEEHGIPVLLIEKEHFFRGNAYVDELKEQQIDFIVLSGFLWKIPVALIRAYPQKMVNIHPALLPKFGGKGMYGRFVHEAVLEQKEKESGISIHFVDDLYDHGEVIFQARCNVHSNDTAETLAQRIHELEHKYFATEIEKLLVS